MASFTSRNSGVAPTLRNFLSACAPLAQRDQAVFLKAVEATCTLQSRDGRKLISLIDKREENAEKTVSDTLASCHVYRGIHDASADQEQKSLFYSYSKARAMRYGPSQMSVPLTMR